MHQTQTPSAPSVPVPLIDNAGSPHAKLRCLRLDEVTLTDGFWARRFERARTVTLPRLWELAEPWAWHNLLVAAGLKEGGAKGCRWEDAWVYKWIEAACYFQVQHPDPATLRLLDEIVAVIAKAQQPDGYIATQVTLRGFERLSFQGNHELYTMGHLMTAACAHQRLTGDDRLLAVACRAADWVHRTYTTNPDPMLANCPINPSIIMGAAELFRTTGEPRYLELANIIINNRGRARGKVSHTDWGPAGNSDNCQDRIPLRQETEVVGHAVFWSYLFAGAADTYMETGDESLLAALARLWTDLTTRKLYITGGVCPHHKGFSTRDPEPGRRTITNDVVHEAAATPYELPNATAYNETCGQIGTFMWGWRMLAITGEARYAETMERTLYNAILAGVNLSGQGWSYTNPLRWYGREHVLLNNDYHQRVDPGEKNICCPTNLMRTEASWNAYLYMADETGLWVHHYAASQLATVLPGLGRLELAQTTDFPWDGRITLAVRATDIGEPFALHLRIPPWTVGATVSVNGANVATPVVPSSYLTLERQWQAGDTIELDFPMPVRLMTGHPMMEHAHGHVAVTRGPIVYCLESTDLPEGVGVGDIRLPRNPAWTIRHDPELLTGVTVLEAEAVALPVPTGQDLYQPLGDSEPRPVPIRLIPYFAWNNRGEPEMAVWLPLD